MSKKHNVEQEKPVEQTVENNEEMPSLLSMAEEVQEIPKKTSKQMGKVVELMVQMKAGTTVKVPLSATGYKNLHFHNDPRWKTHKEENNVTIRSRQEGREQNLYFTKA